MAAHLPLPPNLDDLIAQARVMHYRSLASQAAGKRTCEFRSHWLEGTITCEYEVEEAAHYQHCTIEAGAELVEIFIGGIPMLQHLNDVTVLHVGDEMRKHLAAMAASEAQP